MLKYYIQYTLDNKFCEVIDCYEASINEGVFIFRNASGQVLLAVPATNVAFIKLHED